MRIPNSREGYNPEKKSVTMEKVQCSNCGFLTFFEKELLDNKNATCYWCKSQAFHKVEDTYQRFTELDKAGIVPAYAKSIGRLI